jgi:hypothetical protein
LRELGQLEEAVASLQEALRLCQNSAEARDNLALAMQAQRRLDDESDSRK